MFGPLIKFNPETDEPPVLEEGQKAQLWFRDCTWAENEARGLWYAWEWDWRDEDACAYRIWTEPKFETVRLRGYKYDVSGWIFGRGPAPSDTHTLDLPTRNGDLIPGEYVHESGAKIVVGRV